MPYVSKDDIMLYIDSQITLQQGVATNVNLILYKDYINNQLNAADADAITVTLYNSLGQRTFQYSDPIIAGQTDRLIVGQPASTTQGHISFDISANQAASLADGDIFVQVTITYSNYYPSAKTYVLPLLQVGYKNQPGTPSNAGGSNNGGSGSGNTGIDLGDLSGLTPYVAYNVSHIDGSNPDVKSVSFDSPDPTQVTEIIFYNLDLNNHRNVYLENFLENRIEDGVDGTITVVDADNAVDYSVYRINSWSRINAEANGGDDNDNDYTKIVVSYEDNSYTPIEAPYTWAVGDTISYALDAFGGAGSGNSQPGQPGQAGTSGTSGINGIDGNPGRDGVDGAAGVDGTSGSSGTSGINGLDGAAGIDGNDGTSGSSGTSGINGLDGAAGAAGANGTSGSSGTSGINGLDGAAGAAGANGTSGSSGTSGINGLDGAAGIDGNDGTSGSSGTSGISGTSGSSGSSGTSGISGTSGSSGTSGISGTSGSSGTSGAQGLQGPPGMGITFKGSVSTFTALPTADLVIGDAYIADDTDHLYVWNGSEWADGGSIQGPAGNPGNSGTSGSSGTSGISGTSGSSGTSGISGTSGSSGTSGTSGISGTSGSSGTSGAQGIQGPAGDAGSSGTSGSSGVNGDAGTSGSSGTSGAQGDAGSSGTSGSSGINGDAGTSGSSGTSGAQGIQGPAGGAGTSGSSGTSGNDGVGIPSGGTSGQVLTKVDSSLYNVTWTDPTGGSGAGYTKYLLRLNYDTQEELISGTTSHSFESKTGYETTGSSITAVTSGATGSISVQFNEDNPPISILVMAYNPVDDSYKVHHYDKDAANVIINTASANFVGLGNNQYEPNFFGNFTVGMTIDTRQDFIKFGNSVSSGFPPVTKNAHAYVIFVF